jgi:putative endonuclease
MADHIRKGREGEKTACAYLESRGYRILEYNWRSGHREIDIIAEYEGKMIIVEVKSRHQLGTERLDEHITRKKQQHLIRAAAAYLANKGLRMDLRFDIILLVGKSVNQRIEHIEDAFGPWDF